MCRASDVLEGVVAVSVLCVGVVFGRKRDAGSLLKARTQRAKSQVICTAPGQAKALFVMSKVGGQ